MVNNLSLSLYLVEFRLVIIFSGIIFSGIYISVSDFIFQGIRFLKNVYTVQITNLDIKYICMKHLPI